MIIKEINKNKLFTELEAGAKVYALVPITDATSIADIMNADKLVVEDTEPEPEPEKKKNKPAGRKPIDKQKVGALYRQGWDTKKIAEECRCSDKSVYKIVAELKKAAAEAGGES